MSPSKSVRYLLLVCLTLPVAYLISEITTDAIPSMVGYYLYDYEGVTTGVVVESRLDNDGPYRVKYEYNVGGEIFSSELVNHSANYRSVAYETVQKYPISKEVTVYYDLAFPDEAILERTSPGFWIWGQIFATLVMSALCVHYFVIEKIFGELEADEFLDFEEFDDSIAREKFETFHSYRSKALYLIIAGSVLSFFVFKFLPDNDTTLGVVFLIASIVLFVIWREMKTHGYYIDTEIGDGTREGSPIIHSIYLLTFMGLSVSAFFYGWYLIFV